MISSIQQLSNNRFLLGVGPGYLEEEFKALGINLKDRGKITNETLDFLIKASKDSKIISNGQEILLEPKTDPSSNLHWTNGQSCVQQNYTVCTRVDAS